MNVSYRRLARMYVLSLPIHKPEKFSAKVEEYVQTIEALPLETQLALKAAYIFSHIKSIPADEREDLFQDFALAVYKTQTTSEALAYTVARRTWISYVRKILRRKEILNGISPSLKKAVGDCHEEIADEQTTERVLRSLPAKIKAIILKRLQREALSTVERARLSRYLKVHGQQVRELVTAS